MYWLLQSQRLARVDQVPVAGPDPRGVQLPEAIDLERDVGDARRRPEEPLGDRPQALAGRDDVRRAITRPLPSSSILRVRPIPAPAMGDRHREGERLPRGRL